MRLWARPAPCSVHPPWNAWSLLEAFTGCHGLLCGVDGHLKPQTLNPKTSGAPLQILAHNAVHAAFAGFTGITSGLVNTHYVYLPIPIVISSPRRVRCPPGQDSAREQGVAGAWQRVAQLTCGGQAHQVASTACLILACTTWQWSLAVLRFAIIPALHLSWCVSRAGGSTREDLEQAASIHWAAHLHGKAAGAQLQPPWGGYLIRAQGQQQSCRHQVDRSSQTAR